jgi:peptidoglycan L-alanyl-D-glutamate endopeptidase CwlK
MSRSLDDLDPRVRPLVDTFLASAANDTPPIDLLVTCTRRTNDEQAVIYAKGRTAPGPRVTNAPPGQSAHNYGLAIDVVPVVNGKPDWIGADPVWHRVGALGQAAGLEWAGAPGFPFPEEPHFQLPGWRAAAGI